MEAKLSTNQPKKPTKQKVQPIATATTMTETPPISGSVGDSVVADSTDSTDSLLEEFDEFLSDPSGSGSGTITEAKLSTISPRIDSEASSMKPAFGTGTPSRLEGIEDAKLLDKTVTAWPPAPADNLTWDTFQAWYRTLTNYHHQHFIGYLYRRDPMINRPKGERYIDVFGGSLESGPDPNLTLDYIIGRHGGGKYKLTVNNSSLSRSSKNTTNEIFNVNFEIEWSTAMPKLDIKELVISKQNKGYIDYLVREGKMTPAGEIIQPTPTTNETAAVVKEVMDLVKGLLPQLGANRNNGGGMEKEYLSALTAAQSKMIDLMRERKGDKSDLESLMALLPIVERLVGNATQSKPDDGMGKFMLAIMEQNQQLLRLVVEKVNTPPPPPPPPVDPFDQLGKMIDLQNKLREQNPVASGGGDDDDDKPTRKKSNWEMFFDNLPQILTPILTVGPALLARYAVGNQPGTGAATQPANPNPNGIDLSTPVPTQPTGALVPMNQPTNPATPGSSTLPLDQDPNVQELISLLQSHGQLFINAIYEGKHGGEMAQMYVMLKGGPTNGFAQISALGEENIMGIFKAIPQFWSKVAAKEVQVRQFVKEFVNYPQSLEWPDSVDGEEEGIVQ